MGSGGGCFAAGVALQVLVVNQIHKNGGTFHGDNQVLMNLAGRRIEWQWGQYLVSCEL